MVPGELRKYDVVVGPYKAPSHHDLSELVDALVVWLDKQHRAIVEAETPEKKFTNALLAAILAHLFIAWIHPFGNGNGRTARLVEVQILSESGIVPMVATNVLSNFYNQTRHAYYLALNEAQRDVASFVHYAVGGFLDEVRLQIERVRAEGLTVHWESFVYEVFNKRPNTDARARQRALALCLPHDRFLTPEEIVDLTPRLARKYATCGDRTPARDLNDLVKMGLVERQNRREYRARREIIEAFLPPVAGV